MQIFVRVAETNSFSKAADTLNLPRATVSTVIQQLEMHLSVRLMNRTTRKVSLTLDGSAYYDRCVRLLADLEETEAYFRQDKAKPRGKLKVDLPIRLARLVIIPLLPEFFAAYPDIELELGVTDRPVDLIQEGVDCAIRVGELADSRLVAKRIGAMHEINCASPSYLAKFGTPESIEDLANHIAVKYASPATGKVYDWEYIENGEVKTVAMKGNVSVNNSEAYVASAVAGLGLVQLPMYDSFELLESGKLVEILKEYKTKPLPLSVVYPHRRHLSHRVRAFVEWVETICVGKFGALN